MDKQEIKIRKRIKELAEAYQTEWVYDKDGRDAGAAIANAFVKMQLDTKERLQKISNKYEMEFYNMLGPYASSAIPAKCYFSFLPSNLSQIEDNKLPDKLEVYTNIDSENITFTMKESITLSDAIVTDIIYADWKNKYVVKGYHKEETKKHSFVLWDYNKENQLIDSIRLHLKPIFEFDMEPEFEILFMNQKDEVIKGDFLNKLCKAKWLLRRKGYTYILESDLNQDDHIFLSIKNEDLLAKEDLIAKEGFIEEDNLIEATYVSCIFPSIEDTADFSFSNIGINYSSKKSDAQYLISEEGIVALDEAVRIFPYMMDKVDCFYIGDNKTFSKKGAYITLDFQMHYEVEKVLPVIEKTKYKLIMGYLPVEITNEVKEQKPMLVRWEYFNGSVWCELIESKQWNHCFDIEQYEINGKTESKQYSYTFRCPEDINPCMIEGITRYFLRIKLYKVSNLDAVYKIKYYPMISKLKLNFSYQKNKELINEISIGNGIEKKVYNKEKIGQINIQSIIPIHEERELLYLVFDKKPNPDFRVCFQILGQKGEKDNVFISLNGTYDEKDFIGTYGYFLELERYHIPDLKSQTTLGVLNKNIIIDSIKYNCVMGENIKYKHVLTYIDLSIIPFTIKLEEERVSAIQVLIKEIYNRDEKWMLWEVVESLNILSGNERKAYFDYQAGILTFHQHAFIKFKPVIEQEGIQIHYLLCDLTTDKIKDNTDFMLYKQNDMIFGVNTIGKPFGGVAIEENRIIDKLKSSDRLVSLYDIKKYITVNYPYIKNLDCIYHAENKELSLNILLETQKNYDQFRGEWNELKDYLLDQFVGEIKINLQVYSR